MKPKPTLHVMPAIDPPAQINPGLASKVRRAAALTTEELVQGVLAGNRTILSKAITLTESSLEAHRRQAEEVIEGCLKGRDEGRLTNDEGRFTNDKLRFTNDKLKGAHPTIRVGITGVPGVGKSTFIEALGKYLTGRGHKLAVLAVDPSSTRSKGSILGDKTRMEELAVDPNAFIRPSPSAGSLGGVARKTRETILLCEAAGFDVIFVETVGVGQSETAVHSMVDFFLLLMLSGAGDELQGIKRGIIEMADAIYINKADGDNIDRARTAKAEYAHALHLFPPSASGWIPQTGTCSARTREGIAEVWETVCAYRDLTLQNGYFAAHRKEQDLGVLHDTVREELHNRFYSRHDIATRMQKMEKAIAAGQLNPYQAARQLLNEENPF